MRTEFLAETLRIRIQSLWLYRSSSLQALDCGNSTYSQLSPSQFRPPTLPAIARDKILDLGRPHWLFILRVSEASCGECASTHRFGRRNREFPSNKPVASLVGFQKAEPIIRCLLRLGSSYTTSTFTLSDYYFTSSCDVDLDHLSTPCIAIKFPSVSLAYITLTLPAESQALAPSIPGQESSELLIAAPSTTQGRSFLLHVERRPVREAALVCKSIFGCNRFCKATTTLRQPSSVYRPVHNPSYELLRLREKLAYNVVSFPHIRLLTVHIAGPH